jgi:hypothetical protein
MSRAEFAAEPAILFEVGASGGLNPAWSKLAKYSVCVAFDPDDREMYALVNNLFARYLLAVGNPFLLFALLFLVTPSGRQIPCRSAPLQAAATPRMR